MNIQCIIKEAADLYDQMIIPSHDQVMFLKQALLHNGPILELCSGSGRLTLPLIKRGYQITAVDLSEDMLNNMQRIINKEYEKYKSKLSIILGDMTKLNIKNKFNLIMIGATSIRLVENDFIYFFNNMYEMLNDKGGFIFDFEDLPMHTGVNHLLESPEVFDLESSAGELSLLCTQRYIDYSKKNAVVNLMKIASESNEKVLLSWTKYRIFAISDIISAAKESYFGDCQIIPTSYPNYYFCKMVK